MSKQVIYGIFLIIIGVIGALVGRITGHFADSTGQIALYLLPILLGVIMLLVDRTSK